MIEKALKEEIVMTQRVEEILDLFLNGKNLPELVAQDCPREFVRVAIRLALAKNKYVSAIQIYRSAYGASLKEAKEAVDLIRYQIS